MKSTFALLNRMQADGVIGSAVANTVTLGIRCPDPVGVPMGAEADALGLAGGAGQDGDQIMADQGSGCEFVTG